jgi:hypothetical protein
MCKNKAVSETDDFRFTGPTTAMDLSIMKLEPKVTGQASRRYPLLNLRRASDSR